ncbi:HpsJ family protein [Argonema antarcticum]|uniref:hormogonium polysaccharide biosynthesis protein HpsJ n=1 Tax=Argonema antarcticum TaxID=2942763 RepID=UPI002010E199|nr:HpsJ family protein [Argonema antarcticum]MCL1470843.1 HpsJ family protein [Argonema antarcticum A004/B2]
MKGSANRLISAPAALISKLVGTILILSFLLDTVTLLIPSSPPFSPLDRGWQLTATTQLVERGFIPMLGMALLFLGSWMDDQVDGQGSGQPWQLVKLGALVLSGILGLVFLLAAPLHINNVRLASNEGLQRIQQQATQAETQLSSPDFRAQVEQRRTQIKTQIGDLLKDDQRLNQALQSGQVPDQLKTVLQQSKDNPSVLDNYLEQQAKDFSNQTLTQVRDRKQQLEKQAKMGALKSQVQIGLSSLFLAIGYFIITGTGLSGVLSSPKIGPRKAPKR